MKLSADELLNALADLVAERVVQKLQDSTGASWPNTNNDPGDEVVKPKEPELIEGLDARRMNFWNGKTAQTIRDHLAAFEQEGIAKYNAMNKAKLVKYIAGLEAVTGKDLWSYTPEPEPADEVVQPEPEPEDEEGVTKEDLLRMDLSELKEIAVEEGIPEDKLAGLDVDAVVDMIWDLPEDDVLTQEAVMDMDIESLKELAKQNNVEYDPDISRTDLAMTLVRKFGE